MEDIGASFRQALIAWVDAATDYTFQSVQLGQMRIPQVVRHVIVRDTQPEVGAGSAESQVATYFGFDPRASMSVTPALSWSSLVDQERDQFKNLPQYSGLLKQASANVQVQEFMLKNSPGQDLTNPTIIDLLLFGIICDPLLCRALAMSVGLSQRYVDRVVLLDMCQGMEEQVQGGKSRWRAIVPLLRVHSTGGELRLMLSASLTIRRATDDDRECWMSATDVLGAAGGAYTPLLTASVAELEQMVDVGAQPDFITPVRHLVTGMRLFNRGGLTVPCVVYTHADRWLDEKWMIQPFGASRPELAGQGMTLDTHEQERFGRFWRWYVTATSQLPGPLEIALRRAERASGDAPVEDRLIDCCVAFDALLGAGTAQEVTYKVRMRGAFLLGEDPERRRRIYELLGKVYSARGSIIHGSSRPEEALAWFVERASTTSGSVGTFMFEVVDLLGRLIRAMLSLKLADLGDGRRYSFDQNSAGHALDVNMLKAGELRQHFSEWV